MFKNEHLKLKIQIFKIFDTEFQETGSLKRFFTRVTKRRYFYAEYNGNQFFQIP